MTWGRLSRSLLVISLALATTTGFSFAGSGPAHASDVWAYQGWLTLDGRANWTDSSRQVAGFTPKQLDVYVDLRVEDGRVASGFVTAGQCIRETRSATVTFTGRFEECTGTITFAGLGTPSLTIASVNLLAPPNDTTFVVDFTAAPTTALAGVNLSPSKPKLPPLAPPVMSVTTGVIDPVQQTIQAQALVALPQGYPPVAQSLTYLPAGSATAIPLSTNAWTAIPCGVTTTFVLTVSGTNTDPATQSTASTVTPNCTARIPTLTLLSQTGDSATFTYRLSDGGPVEAATWTATSGVSASQNGTAMPPGGGNGADFTVTNLVPGSRTRVRVVVFSAGSQTRQSNTIDVWTAAPSFTYPPIIGRVGVPIRQVTPTPAVDPASVSKLSPNPGLAPGLKVDPVTGAISGTPTAAATGLASLNFTYAGSLNQGNLESAKNAISYAISGRGTEPTFGVVTLVGEVGVPIAPVSIASSIGNLPSGARFAAPALCDLGLRVDPITGIISGTPIKAFIAAGKQLRYFVTAGGSGNGCRITGSPITGIGADGAPTRLGGIATTIAPLPGPRIWYSPGMAISKQIYGTVGSALSVPGPALAGAPTATYSLATGTLPPGLTLDPATGAIGGVPTTAGLGLTVTLVAKNAAGASSAPITVEFDIASQPVTNTLSYPSPMSVRVGQALSVSPSGTVSGQSFALDRASLAAGLAIDSATGRVTWTPGAAQVGSRVVAVTESSPGRAPTTVTFTARVDLAPAALLAQNSGTTASGSVASGSAASGSASTGSAGASSGATGSGTEPSACLAPSGKLFDDMVGSVGSTMTYAPNTSGIGRPVAFRVNAGSLPSGVVLDATYGIVSGTPRQPNAGVGPVTIQATFAGGAVLSSSVNIAVDDPHHSANYPNRVIGSVGSPTAITPEAFDTDGDTTYTLVCGELPAGMTLSRTTGVISGIPTAPVDYPTPLRIRQRDAYGSVDASLIMVVDSAPTPWIRYPEHPIAAYRQRVVITPTLSELSAGTTFRLTGTLPRGLVFDRRTGVISGTPTGLAQNRPLTVTSVAKDGRAITATSTSITVRKATVPLSVTARHVNVRLGTKRVVLVVRSQHPKWTTATTRVVCTGCVPRISTKSGRVTVAPGPRTTRVTVTVIAAPKQPGSSYRPHVWTRTWFIRK